jgi:hypothetical protein
MFEEARASQTLQDSIVLRDKMASFASWGEN